MILVWVRMVFTFLSCFGSPDPVLGGEEMRQYSGREFIELEESLILRGKIRLARQIQRQSEDLGGCRTIHKGVGSVASVIQCMRFINRERSLGIVSPGRGELTEDINILCLKLMNRPGALEKIIESQVLKTSPGPWARCGEAAWKQVYLTAYANFDADPVRILSFVRKAQHDLPFDRAWTAKIMKLIKSS